MLGADLDQQIEATRPVLDAAHERNFPVLFSTVRYDDVELRDAGIWALKMKGRDAEGRYRRRWRLIRVSTTVRPTACC